MPDKQGSTVEKWKDAGCSGCGMPGMELNPAYVDELEGFAKEMAEAVVKSWQAEIHGTMPAPNKRGVVTDMCAHCQAPLWWEYSLDPPTDAEFCSHTDSCPVPRAQEYLKEK